MGSYRSSVDQPGCESSEGVVEFRDSNSKRVTWESENLRYCAKKMLISPAAECCSQQLFCAPFSSQQSFQQPSQPQQPSFPASPATAAASTIPKELAGPARTEDGDRDVQGTAHP